MAADEPPSQPPKSDQPPAKSEQPPSKREGRDQKDSSKSSRGSKDKDSERDKSKSNQPEPKQEGKPESKKDKGKVDEDQKSSSGRPSDSQSGPKEGRGMEKSKSESPKGEERPGSRRDSQKGRGDEQKPSTGKPSDSPSAPKDAREGKGTGPEQQKTQMPTRPSERGKGTSEERGSGKSKGEGVQSDERRASGRDLKDEPKQEKGRDSRGGDGERRMPARPTKEGKDETGPSGRETAPSQKKDESAPPSRDSRDKGESMAPGRKKEVGPSGREFVPPGHDTTPPGHGGTPPGKGGTPPGHEFTPPGHDKEKTEKGPKTPSPSAWEKKGDAAFGKKLNDDVGRAKTVLKADPKEAKSQYTLHKGAAIETRDTSREHTRHDMLEMADRMQKEQRDRMERERKEARRDEKREHRETARGTTLAISREKPGQWNFVDPRKVVVPSGSPFIASGTGPKLVVNNTFITNNIINIDVDFNVVHVHGPGCGHYFYNNCWNDFAQGEIPWWSRNYYWDGVYHAWPRSHIHGPGCGHYFEGGSWLSYCGSYHHHHAGCGHYFYGGFWHNYPVWHIHYPGCGHFFYDDCWHDFPEVHVHSATCGHLYDGVSWYVSGIPQHNYYDGCGYYNWDDVWHIYPRSYYAICRPQSFFFFVNLGPYDYRGVPDYVYETQAKYEPEPMDIFEHRADHPAKSAYADFADKNYYRAITEFNEAIRSNKDDGLLLFARAQTYIAIGDFRAAYADIIDGMGLIPDWGRVKFNMTELYSDPDDFTNQLKALEQWVEDHPRDYQAHFVLGYVYYFIQEYDLAKEELVFTLAYSEDHPQAKRLIEDIYERQAEAEAREKSTASAFPTGASVIG